MKKGFTLIEVVMSLALFMILSFGVLLLWQYTSRSAASAIRTQNALDNLGIAMDGLLTNIELSHTLYLQTGGQNRLRRLSLRSLNPNGLPHIYTFTFDPNAHNTSSRYKSLFFGGPLGQQQFAYGIETIHIVNHDNRRLNITITSVCLCRTRCAQVNLCSSRISISGSADIIHKHVTN